ncbi:hypothetical protein PCASD_23991 [Puccinia coronata f. sp. avenae]|uniref:SAM domain-containing protein n=1 Tax=Puccinia coronata f. sp. avenae TaxID=200324 RepID=A0A2N5S572_9BASI|nr:hypothetical protein PCASD_23991 [Puccinia coronata f. sp. avenae]
MPRAPRDKQSNSSTLQADGNQQAISSRPARQFQSNSDYDFSMSVFLDFCRIPPADKDVWDVIKRHQIHHWFAFIDEDKYELERLGFAFGPDRLIPSGISRLRKLIRQ